MVAVPSLMSVPPDTVVVDSIPHVAPLATVTVPGPSKLPPVVVSEPVIVRAPVPLTTPENTRGTPSVWLAVTPRVPWTSRVPVPVTTPENTRGTPSVWLAVTPRVPWTSRVPVPETDPVSRLSVADATSRMPEASWIDAVLLTTRLPPVRVAVPVE